MSLVTALILIVLAMVAFKILSGLIRTLLIVGLVVLVLSALGVLPFHVFPYIQHYAIQLYHSKPVQSAQKSVQNYTQNYAKNQLANVLQSQANALKN